MVGKLLNLNIIAFSIMLGFGTLDLFYFFSSIYLVDIFFITFILLFLLLDFKGLVSSLISIDFIGLFLVFFFLILAQTLNGYSELLKPLANYKFLMCIVFFSILSDFFTKSINSIHQCLIAYSVSCFIFCVLVYFVFPSMHEIIKGQLIILDENPNSTSSRLSIAALYIVYFIVRNPLNWNGNRFLTIIFLPLLIYLIILSGSRGSLISTVVGIYIIFLLSNIKKYIKVIFSTMIFVSSVTLFKFVLKSEDLGMRWEKALDGDTAGRTEIWETVIRISFENPLGIGETGYVEEMSKYYGYYIDTHNLFLYILVCGGIVSLIIFTIIWCRIFFNAFRVYILEKDILPMLLFVVILFLVSKTGGAITFLLFWFVFSTIKGYTGLVCNERKNINTSLASL